MTSHYCETCKEYITNKWAIIGNKHVGCPKAKGLNKMTSIMHLEKTITDYLLEYANLEGIPYSDVQGLAMADSKKIISLVAIFIESNEDYDLQDLQLREVRL